MKLKLLITKIWFRYLCPIWSVIPNLFFILTRIRRIPRELAAMRCAREYYRDENVDLPRRIAFFNLFLQNFEWREEAGDWRPWVITIHLRSLRDDCDGAAILARWALRHMGEDARLVHLYPATGWEGHMICVCDRLRIIASNGSLTQLQKANAKANAITARDLLTLFPAYAGVIS